MRQGLIRNNFYSVVAFFVKHNAANKPDFEFGKNFYVLVTTDRIAAYPKQQLSTYHHKSKYIEEMETAEKKAEVKTVTDFLYEIETLNRQAVRRSVIIAREKIKAQMRKYLCA